MSTRVTRSQIMRRQPTRRSKVAASKKTGGPLSKRPVLKSNAKPADKAGPSSRRSEVRRRAVQTNVAIKNIATHRNIHVGDDYQAVVPLGPAAQGPSTSPEREICVWQPNEGTVDLDKFCIKVYDRCGLNSERALYYLYVNDMDEEKALKAAEQSINLEERWSEEDIATFHGLFTTYGRDFAKIHQIMPHKSMRALIEHYYRVKMIRYKMAGLKETKLRPSPRDSDDEEDFEEPQSRTESQCENCGAVAILHPINCEMQCLNCKKYFEEFNKNRPVDRSKRRPNLKFEPEAQFLSHEMKKLFAKPKTAKEVLVELERKKEKLSAECRRVRMSATVQFNRCSRAFAQITDQVDLKKAAKLSATPRARFVVKDKWSAKEKEIALRLLVRYLGDCKQVAHVLRTKSEEQVEDVYQRYKTAIKKEMDTTQQNVQECADEINDAYDKLVASGVEVIDLE